MEQDYDITQGKPDCRSAESLLKEVTAEIAGYEAKKLPALKDELDQFVKDQAGLVTDYVKAFPDLRKTWCDRQKDIERLCTIIRCEFPLKEERWRHLVEHCICKPLHEICCLRRR